MKAIVIALVVAMGSLCGLGFFTFGYGDGSSYLRNDPAACANCHVMQEQYDSWMHSGHHHVATCNDCHLSPHKVRKWITKMENGFLHSLAFTTGDFPEPIRIKPRNRQVTQSACVACHDGLVHAVLAPNEGSDELQCLHCHVSAGHALK